MQSGSPVEKICLGSTRNPSITLSKGVSSFLENKICTKICLIYWITLSKFYDMYVC